MNSIEHYPIEDKEKFTANTFLDFLRLSKGHWWNDNPTETKQEWVFRGMSNSNYGLLPSGLRSFNRDSDNISEMQRIRLYDKIAAKFKPHLKPKPKIETLDTVGHYEFTKADIWRICIHEGIAQFINMAREINLIEAKWMESLVNPSNLNIDHWDTVVVRNNTDVEHDVMALAQHHGIPTQLLDWTFDPIIAAYFATETWTANKASDIAVWAFNERIWQKQAKALEALDKKQHNYLRQAFGTGLIRPAKTSNIFLSAQSGVLTLIPGKYHETEARWLGADEILVDNEVDQPFLRKIILSSEHVSELKSLLRREGVSKAKFMPTLDNVATTVRNSW